MRLTPPIKEVKTSEFYAFVVTDSNEVIHYFDFDGHYDGYSSDCHMCGATGANLN